MPPCGEKRRKIWNGKSVVIVLAAGTVDMLLPSRRRHEGLSGNKDVSRFMFLLEMCSDFRMVRFDIPDQPSKKPAGLKIIS